MHNLCRLRAEDERSVPVVSAKTARDLSGLSIFAGLGEEECRVSTVVGGRFNRASQFFEAILKKHTQPEQFFKCRRIFELHGGFVLAGGISTEPKLEDCGRWLRRRS